jgi:hypothetical protein
MNGVKFFVGGDDGEDISEVLERVNGLPAWQPFDSRAMAFVGRLSQQILKHPRIKDFPDLAALGHWFRPARLHNLAQAHPAESDQWVRRGRGLAFHLAPANVDSVFMYSWLLSLLAGNVNWVRVSQKPSEQLDFLLEVLRIVLKEEIGMAVNGRIVLMTYPHDAGITAFLSQESMVRVVWGGDETVGMIRTINLKPTAVEICFPDRFSAAALRSEAILCATDEELCRLADAFYNDAFWFAQQACSSPRLLAWVGEISDCEKAQERFWTAVRDVVIRKGFENTPAMNMARLGTTFQMAAQGLVTLPGDAEIADFPSRLLLVGELDSDSKQLHCGNGLFFEQQLPRLAQLASQLTDKEQTLAVFGFDRSELLDMVDRLPPRAVDRIVSIGDALNFDVVWDGVDLIQFFSRQISLPFKTMTNEDKACMKRVF